MSKISAEDRFDVFDLELGNKVSPEPMTRDAAKKLARKLIAEKNAKGEWPNFSLQKVR